MIDDEFKPWILEVNISPSFSSSSPFDKNLKTKLICDALTIVGIKPTNHEEYEKKHKKNTLATRFNPLSPDLTTKSINDFDPQNLNEEDKLLLLDFEEEIRRCQNFELIFPIRRQLKYYTKFFQEKRYNNYLLWNHIKDPLIDTESLLE